MRGTLRSLLLALLVVPSPASALLAQEQEPVAPAAAAPTDAPTETVSRFRAPGPPPAVRRSGTAAEPLTEDEAWAHLRRLDPVGATEAYAALVRDRAERLAAADAAGDAETAAALAAEIEVLVVALERAGRWHDDWSLVRSLLADVAVAPRHGMAYAAVHAFDLDRARTLGMLTDWEFAGPFDNERGAALASLPPACADPARESRYPGKVREVGWRRTPTPARPNGIVEFAHLVRPWKQAAVVARTWVRSDTDRDALLMLGVGEEARAWHDGAPILDAREAHDFSLDALAVPVRLHAGWNELAVLLGSRDDRFSMTARLVDAATGEPLFLESSAAPDDGPPPRVLADAAAPAFDPAVRPGALARLAGATDAESLRRRAILLATYSPAPRHEFPGRAEALAARDAAPDDLRMQLLAMDFLSAPAWIGLAEFDPNPWQQAVRDVLERSPDEPWALFSRALFLGWLQHAPTPALATFDRALAVLPDCLMLDTERARLADEFGLGAVADAGWRRVLAHPDLAHFPSAALDAADAVLPEGSADYARLVAEAAAASPRTKRLMRAVAVRRARAAAWGADDELAALEEVLAVAPWASWPRLDAAEHLLAMGEVEAAEAVLRDAVAVCPELARAHALLARCALARDDTEAAIAALERATELDFSNEDDRRLLDFLVAANRPAAFEDAYLEPLSAVLERRDAADLPTPIGAGSEVLLWQLVVKVNPDGTAQRAYRKVVRILNDNGVRAYDRPRFQYFPGDQELRVRVADVRHPDGSMEHARTGRGRRSSSVDLPPLAPGDVVDLQWRVDDRHPSVFGRYFGLDHPLTPDPDVPTFQADLVVLEPAELPLRWHGVNLDDDAAEPVVRDLEDGGRELRWRAGPIAPRRLEPNMPPPEETTPRVQVSSYADWQALGRWWWQLIAPGITASPEMRATVARLTTDAATPEERLRAIYDFVANDVRYNAWEFGIHGYQPYTAPVIFGRKFGDCKDKAILMKAMLAEVGIESWPVLIRRAGTPEWQGRRPKQDLTLPLVGHFNHAILFVPEQEGLAERFLDGTARLHPMEVLPYDDRGAEVVIVRDDGVERRTIPFATPDDDREEQRFDVQLHADGSADVEVTITPHGRFDPRYRSGFAGGEEQARETAKRLLTNLLGPYSGDPVITLPDVEELSAPLTYRFSAEAQSFARSAEGGLELPAVPVPSDYLQRFAGQNERHQDLLFDGPFRREVEIVVALPEGWQARDLPAPVLADAPDGAFLWMVEDVGDGTLRIQERFELKSARIPPERYAAFRELCRTADEAEHQSIELVPAQP